MYYNVDEIKKSLSFFNPECFTDDDASFFVEEFSLRYKKDFTWEAGATKCVIIPKEDDFVIKVPFNGRIGWEGEFIDFENGGGEGWDYCDLEQAYFEEDVKGTGFEKFFLVPEYICSINGWPVYIQPKINMYKKSCCPISSTGSSILTMKTKSKNIRFSSLPDEW